MNHAGPVSCSFWGMFDNEVVRSVSARVNGNMAERRNMDSNVSEFSLVDFLRLRFLKEL